MYVKLYSRILDSSLAENRPLRHFFTDLLLLADPDGNVIMTKAAIASRIRATMKEVEEGLDQLSEPDPDSLTPDCDGRRIVPLDGHGYGWKIVNYEEYRDMKTAQELRAKTAERVKRHRERQKEQQVAGGQSEKPKRKKPSANDTSNRTSVDAAARAYEKAVENDEPPEVQDDIVTRSLPEKLQGTIHEIQNLGGDSGRSNGKELEDDLQPEGNERAVDAKLGEKALRDAGGSERVQGDGVSAAGVGQLAVGVREEPGHFENGVWVKD